MKLSSLFTLVTPNSKQKNDRVVGIDIGSSSIKIVELQDREGIVTLTTYGELQLGPYGEEEIGAITTLDQQVEKQALLDILRESATKAKQSVFAIPLAVSFVTVISLLVNEEDLDSRIRIEARKYIPVPLADVSLDWAEIESKLAEEGQKNILLAAIQNKPLGRYKTLLSSISMSKAPTEIECFSTIRGAGVSTKATAAVLDFGATSVKLYITRYGQLQRMYRIPTGATEITKQITAELNITWAEAELLKKTSPVGDENFATLQKIYTNHYNRSLTEFAHVLKEYANNDGLVVDLVVITGSASLFPDFTKQVASTLGYPVIISNPFEMVAYPAFMEDTLKEIGPTFTTALGSALRLFI